MQSDTTFDTDYIMMHVKDSKGKCYIYFINYIYCAKRTGKIAVICCRILYDECYMKFMEGNLIESCYISY